MIIIYSLYSIIIAILTLMFSFIYVSTCWWFLFLPKYKRLKLFTLILANPWIFFVNNLMLLMRIRVIGKENVDIKRTTLYICNHQSWIDVPILFKYSHAVGVSKIQVTNLPLVGFLILYSGGVIFLNREDQSSRISIIKEIMRVFKKGFSVFLFPEGTRSKDGKLLKPNTALIKLCYKLNIPVVPMALEGTREILPRNRIYLKFFKKVILKINSPLFPKDYKNEQDFAEKSWKILEESHDEIIKEYFIKKI